MPSAFLLFCFPFITLLPFALSIPPPQISVHLSAEKFDCLICFLFSETQSLPPSSFSTQTFPPRESFMAVALGKQHLAKGISFILVILKCEMRCLNFDRDWHFPSLFESPCFLRRGDTSDPWLGLLTSGRDLGSAGPHMCLFFPPSLAWPGAILRAWCRADGKGPAGCAVCSAESCSSPELCSWALLVNLSFFPACSFQRKTLGFFHAF